MLTVTAINQAKAKDKPYKIAQLKINDSVLIVPKAHGLLIIDEISLTKNSLVGGQSNRNRAISFHACNL